MSKERALEATDEQGFINRHLHIAGSGIVIDPQVQLCKAGRQGDPVCGGHYFAGVSCLITVVR